MSQDRDAIVDDLFLSIPGTRLKIDDHLFSGYRSLLLSGGWNDEYLGLMEEYGLTAISLNVSHGWDGDTSFLLSLPVQGIHILASRPLSGLVLPPSVKVLCVDAGFEPGAKVTGTSTLEELRATWHPALSEIVAAAERLRSMALWHVRDRDLGDIFRLRNPDALEELELVQALFDSTRHLMVTMPPVRRLTLSYLRRCRDYTLDAESLHHLELDHCRAFNDLTLVGALRSLRELVIKDCGGIQSLSPLGALHALRVVRLLGSTTVDDGDLEPLLNPVLHAISVMRWANHYGPKGSFLARVAPDVEAFV